MPTFWETLQEQSLLSRGYCPPCSRQMFGQSLPNSPLGQRPHLKIVLRCCENLGQSTMFCQQSRKDEVHLWRTDLGEPEGHVGTSGHVQLLQRVQEEHKRPCALVRGLQKEAVEEQNRVACALLVRKGQAQSQAHLQADAVKQIIEGRTGLGGPQQPQDHHRPWPQDSLCSPAQMTQQGSLPTAQWPPDEEWCVSLTAVLLHAQTDVVQQCLLPTEGPTLLLPKGLVVGQLLEQMAWLSVAIFSGSQAQQHVVPGGSHKLFTELLQVPGLRLVPEAGGVPPVWDHVHFELLGVQSCDVGLQGCQPLLVLSVWATISVSLPLLWAPSGWLGHHEVLSFSEENKRSQAAVSGTEEASLDFPVHFCKRWGGIVSNPKL